MKYIIFVYLFRSSEQEVVLKDLKEKLNLANETLGDVSKHVEDKNIEIESLSQLKEEAEQKYAELQVIKI